MSSKGKQSTIAAALIIIPNIIIRFLQYNYWAAALGAAAGSMVLVYLLFCFFRWIEHKIRPATKFPYLLIVAAYVVYYLCAYLISTY